MDRLSACGLGGQPFLDHVSSLGGGLLSGNSMFLGQVGRWPLSSILLTLGGRWPVGKYGAPVCGLQREICKPRSSDAVLPPSKCPAQLVLGLLRLILATGQLWGMHQSQVRLCSRLPAQNTSQTRGALSVNPGLLKPLRQYSECLLAMSSQSPCSLVLSLPPYCGPGGR